MGKFSVLQFFREQWTAVRPVPAVDLSSQTIIIVGANAGLGFEASIHLARMSPGRLIMACRNLEKGQAALKHVETETGCKTVELWQIDLSSFTSVVSFVEKFEKDGGRLDILICNAGILMEKYKPTKDGWESTTQVNHLSTALLSILLIPRLVQTSKEHHIVPRLEIVSSETHFFTKFDNEVLKNEKGILATFGSKEYCSKKVMGVRYFDSKLLNVFFTRALAAHVPSLPSLTVLTVNPGYCYSQIRQGISGFMKIFDRLMEMVLARRTVDGAWQLVYGAVGGRDNEDSLKGAYLSSMKVVEPSDFVIEGQGPEIQEKIWKETLEILRKVSSKVQLVVDQYLV